jgi:hypothetical protein
LQLPQACSGSHGAGSSSSSSSSPRFDLHIDLLDMLLADSEEQLSPDPHATAHSATEANEPWLPRRCVTAVKSLILGPLKSA